jgi:hypothetical protein
MLDLVWTSPELSFLWGHKDLIKIIKIMKDEEWLDGIAVLLESPTTHAIFFTLPMSERLNFLDKVYIFDDSKNAARDNFQIRGFEILKASCTKYPYTLATSKLIIDRCHATHNEILTSSDIDIDSSPSNPFSSPHTITTRIKEYLTKSMNAS